MNVCTHVFHIVVNVLLPSAWENLDMLYNMTVKGIRLFV